jgi:hypothetical protein
MSTAGTPRPRPLAVDRARLRARRWKHRPNSGSVIPLRPGLDEGIHTSSPFDTLTARLIVDQHRRGVLQEGVLIALLAGVGLRP